MCAATTNTDDRGFEEAGKTIAQIKDMVVKKRERVAGALKMKHGASRHSIDIQLDLGDARVGWQFGRGAPHTRELNVWGHSDDARIGVPPLIHCIVCAPGSLDIILDKNRAHRAQALWRQPVE